MPPHPLLHPRLPSPLSGRTALASLAAVLSALTAPAPSAAADTAPDGSAEGPTGPAEHYADLLAEEPEGAAVVIDDAVGGAVPHGELAEDLHAEFGSLDVPYHVVVTPFLGAGNQGGTDEILPAVHDRLGTDGLYVALPPTGMFDEMQIHGFDELSERDGRYALRDADMYGAPVEEVAPVLVAGLAGQAPPADSDGVSEGIRASIEPTSHDGPETLGLLVGSGAGVLLVAGGWLIWRFLRRGRTVPAVAAVLVPVAASGLAVGTGHAFTVSAPEGGDEIPAAEDLARQEAPYVLSTERAERIAAELAEDEPLHVEPIMPLGREGLERIPEAFEDVPVPVYAAVVPSDREDESGGDAEVLAAALSSVAERDGVYLVVAPGLDAPDVGASVRGLEIDSYVFGSLMRGNDASSPATALERAADELAEMEFAPGEGYEPSFADREPNVPGPRAERYWTEGALPGLLVIGPLLGAAAIGLTTLALYLARSKRGRPVSSTPVMDRHALRRVADRETARLRELLDREPERVPDAFMPQAEVALIHADRTEDGPALLGAAVLARRVCAAAQDPDADTEPCAVDPLHPFATERRQTRVTGGQAPLCAECTGLEDTERGRRVLRLSTGAMSRSYRARPNDPWIRYSFGAHEPERMTELLLEENRVR